MKHISGIYKITNTNNNKYYIGSAIDINRRFYTHKHTLKNNTHKNIRLQNAWNKYGEESFLFEVLEEVKDLKKILEREQYWIDSLDATNKGYNICPIAGNTLGKKLSDEAKDKIRKKAIGRTMSEETKKQWSINRSGENNAMFNKKHKEESKEKMKYLKTGESKSDAYSGENNHFYGKQHSEESKKKMSDSKKGRKLRTKLNIEQVIEIKKKLLTKPDRVSWDKFTTEIGKEYNVSGACINNIRRGVRWNDVTI